MAIHIRSTTRISDFKGCSPRSRSGSVACAQAGEPDPKTYWDVKDVRPGMKGKGQTVMVGIEARGVRAPRCWE